MLHSLIELIELAHKGLASQDHLDVGAAESLISLVALHLKHEVVDVPLEQYIYVQRLKKL